MLRVHVWKEQGSVLATRAHARTPHTHKYTYMPTHNCARTHTHTKTHTHIGDRLRKECTNGGHKHIGHRSSTDASAQASTARMHCSHLRLQGSLKGACKQRRPSALCWEAGRCLDGGKVGQLEACTRHGAHSTSAG